MTTEDRSRCSTADINLNRIIDFNDVALCLKEFGQPPPHGAADTNSDSRVDLDDLFLVLSCMGTVLPPVDSQPPNAPPESENPVDGTPTPNATTTPSATPTGEQTPTPSATTTPGTTPTEQQTPIPEATANPGTTPTDDPPPTPTHTATPTQTFSPTHTSTPTPSPSPSGPSLTPIARWDVVPYQRITSDAPLNLAVVAFSADGIDRVEFHIESQHYSGPNPLVVTAPSYNPQTNVHEYWSSLSAQSFLADGWINVEAVVIGNNGGRRDSMTGGGGKGLDALSLLIDTSGSVPQNRAWVSVQGCSDSTAQINNPSKPFCSLYLAIMNVGSGGIVYLRPGTHSFLSSGQGTSVLSTEWITVTSDPAVGGSKQNTTVVSGNALVNVQKLHLKDLTVSRVGGHGVLGPSDSFGGNYQAHMWVEGCTGIGAGQWVEVSYPISGNWRELYYTETTITDADYPLGPTTRIRLARNIIADRIGGDAFQEVSFVVNAHISNIRPHYPLPLINGATFLRTGDPDGQNVVRKSNAFAGYTKNPRNSYGDRFYFSAPSAAEYMVVRKISDDAIEIGQVPNTGTALPASNPNISGFLSTGWHSDVWQHPIGNGDANVILYNLEAREIMYQGLWVRNISTSQQLARNVAIVNVYLHSSSSPPPTWSAGSGWYRSVDHLVFWHNTLQNGGLSFNYNYESGFVGLSNASFRGNMFHQVMSNRAEHNLDLEHWRDNHFRLSGGDYFDNPPTGSTFGDPIMSSDGTPLLGSPLLDRYAPALIADDVRGDPRLNAADVGAVER